MSTGCASLINSPTHGVRINSVPQQASFKIVDQKGNKVAEGITPDIVELRTSAAAFQPAAYYISFDLEDYAETTQILKGKISGWYFVNLLFSLPGYIGAAIVDPFTGTMYNLPNESRAVLLSLPGSSGADKSAVPDKQPILPAESTQ